MNKQVFADIKDNIKNFVTTRRLRDAFSNLRSLAETLMAWEISDEAARAEENYRYMLEYATRGAEDPGRQDMADELAEKILSLLDSLERRNLSAEEPTLYYNTLRYEQNRTGVSIAGLIDKYARLSDSSSLLNIVAAGKHTSEYKQNLAERERLERDIFNRVWTAYPLSASDTEALSDAITGERMTRHYRQFLLSAVMLGGMEFYDQRRLEIMMNAYSVTNEHLSTTAMIGLILMMHRWRNRKLTKRLQSRLNLLRENPGWRSDLRIAYMELVRTRDTDRISAKIRDEVVPEMLKLQPQINKKISETPTSAEIADLEENPEWQEMLEQSGLTDKLKEMSEIQEEGGDVMMGTFAHLKSFPFFSDVANWFLPFSAERSEFTQPENTALQSVAEFFETMGFLCDSDKYSIILSMSQVPAAQRDMMMTNLNAQSEQLDEMRRASLNLPTDSRKNLMNKYVQNLHRFFKLFRRKGEFRNPFESAMNLAAVPALIEDVKDEELLSLVAEFFFSHHYYPEALELFGVISGLSVKPSAALYQKMGHSLLKLGKPDEAILYFEKADMLDNRSSWTLRRLARCYQLMGKPSKALSCLKRLEEMKPDNASTALSIGHCLVELERYDEAIKAYFKAEYLDEASHKALRPLAWCLLMVKDFVQSRKYYEKIIQLTNPTPEDYLNMGHLCLAESKFAEAMNFYKLNISSRTADTDPARTSSDSTSINNFITDMNSDTPALLRIGIMPDLIPLVIDSILYTLD